MKVGNAQGGGCSPESSLLLNQQCNGEPGQKQITKNGWMSYKQETCKKNTAKLYGDLFLDRFQSNIS